MGPLKALSILTAAPVNKSWYSAAQEMSRSISKRQYKLSISSFCIIMNLYFSPQIISFLSSTLISSLLHCEISPLLCVSLKGCCQFIAAIACTPVRVCLLYGLLKAPLTCDTLSCSTLRAFFFNLLSHSFAENGFLILAGTCGCAGTQQSRCVEQTISACV